MNRETQIKTFEEFTSKQKELIGSKGDDYAGDDRLSNFKNGGNISGISSEIHCLALVATKIARLGELLHSKVVKHESIEDTLVDVANYIFLLYCLRAEKNIPYIDPQDFVLDRSKHSISREDQDPRQPGKISDFFESIEKGELVERSSPTTGEYRELERKKIINWVVRRKDFDSLTQDDVSKARELIRRTRNETLEIEEDNLVLKGTILNEET